MSVLLTGEEIFSCYGIPCNDMGTALATRDWATARRGIDMEISKAQLKKVLEYLRTHNVSVSPLYLIVEPDIWQDLLKEIECPK